MRVGDVVHSSFREVWNGKLRQEVMDRLDPSQDCRFHCLRHDTNVEAMAIEHQLSDGVKISPVEEFDRFI